MYWILRAKWDGIDDKTDEFLRNNIWQNGYTEKYYDVVNNVKINDILLLANGSYIEYYAKCQSNPFDGKNLVVDNWIKFETPIFIPAKGNYVKTISSLSNKTYLQRIQSYIDSGKLMEDFIISSLKATDFMSLPNQKINFSKGINIFVGENGSGKSQILKLIYAVIDANNFIAKEKEEADYEKQRAIASSLTDIFRTKSLGNLVKKDKKEAIINLELLAYDTFFSFGTSSKKEVQKISQFSKNFVFKKTIFIPAKEVLSFFPGFRIMYENKYLEFDKCYYNLCRALEEPLNKNINPNSDVIKNLEKILDGKIEIIDGRFYLVSNDNRKYEINIIAEGLRKIGLLLYLLNNGSLDANSILFWDEPESNMHPKLIRDIVKFLVLLANRGMQIFISTHSPYVIESFNNHLKKDKIKKMKINDTEIQNIEALIPKNVSAYYLSKDSLTNILDSKVGLIDDKLLHSFNDINILYDKMRDIEWENTND